MEARILFIVMLVETLFIGGISLLYPRIARKGLLFGVYVGEELFEGEAARRITRSWYRGMIAAILLSVAAGITLAGTAPEPLMAVAPIFLLLLAFMVLYLWAYFQARAIAPSGPPPAAVAPAVAAPAASALLPAMTLIVGVACGVVAIAYAWAHYPALPDSVPTHFGPSGRPDAWRAKSFFTVMLLPIMTLVLGTVLGGVAWLTAHAKRALRRSDEGASLDAQMRFRRAMTRYLCGIAMLVIGMLTVMSIQSIRVAMGAIEGLSALTGVFGIAVAVLAVGGTIYLALRYGQGGARLERARADTPLTDGLADNRHWVLGAFYVNREDPSFLVERRFGFGYTLNFGNWKAVALLAVFLVLILGLTVTALLTN
jgi:uncharacterized membrane protein